MKQSGSKLKKICRTAQWRTADNTHKNATLPLLLFDSAAKVPVIREVFCNRKWGEEREDASCATYGKPSAAEEAASCE
jgi:hypothetical protein